MKKKILIEGALLVLCIGYSSLNWAQVDSPTMYNGSGNNPGFTGSYYGQYCDVNGAKSFGGGYNTDVSGAYSVGLGYNALVTGNNSFGFGSGTGVTGSCAVGMGYNADATGHYSLSLGSQTLSSGSNSLAIGSYVQSTVQGAMTLGFGYNGASPLVNNISKSLMIGFNSDLPTITVGSSFGTGTVGNVGIGGAPSSIKRLTVSKLNCADWEYGLSVVVDNDKARALTVNDAGGDDLFVVWGTGSVNMKKLYVEEVEVRVDAMQAMWWPDYVFNKDYDLRPLSEVNDFIKSNCHLPDVPSEEEILTEGLNLAEMDAILLRKVEELTLYIIEQQKEIEELKKLMESTLK